MCALRVHFLAIALIRWIYAFRGFFFEGVFDKLEGMKLVQGGPLKLLAANLTFFHSGLAFSSCPYLHGTSP